MLVRLFLTAALAAGFAAAQGGGDEGGMGGRGGGGGGRGGGGEMGGGGGMPQTRRQTKAEMFLDKLKLNSEQKDEAIRILSAASEKAAPTRELINKGREVMANAMLGKASEDDIKKVMSQYTTVSATMTGIEAEAFGKIYAMLKPNQQAKAPQAFELMAGMFAGGPGGGGRGGQGRGGQGRSQGRQ